MIHSGHMPTGLKFVYLGNYLPDGSHLELIQATEQAHQGFKGMQAVMPTGTARQNRCGRSPTSAPTWLPWDNTSSGELAHRTGHIGPPVTHREAAKW